MVRVIDGLSRWLNEPLMGFLALLALVFALVPELFLVSPAVERGIGAGEWVIVGLFAAEYLLNLVRATDRRAYVLGFWRILDLVTIMGPVVSLLPQVSDSLRSSPVLRLLRLFRAVLFGARAGGFVARERSRQKRGGVDEALRISVVRPEDRLAPRQATWNELVEWVAGGKEEWYHVLNLEPEKLAQLGRAARLPPGALEAGDTAAVRPRIEASEGCSIVSLAIPVIERKDRTRVDRVGTLLITTSNSLLTVSRGGTDVQAAVADALPGLKLPNVAFSTRMTYALLHTVLVRNKEALTLIEEEIRGLETVPAMQSSPAFFEETFRLEKELSSARADLWRLKSLHGSLAAGRARIQGGGGEDGGFLRGLAEESDELHETASNLRELLVSLIDLHMNVASFQMNKVMRLLAVVSVLGLIPAVVGGMFGMNLEGNPWPLTLPQVSFGVSMGMLLCLYAFFVKGWMR